VAITVVQGTGARNFVSSISKGAITPPFSCALACKSLGSIISADLEAQPEIESRVSSVQRAYFKRGRIWTCPNVPWKLKRILLLGDIQGSALMGLESFIISPHQLGILDRAIAIVARSAMRGKAVCRDPQSGHVVAAMANTQVLHHWRIVTCSTELAVRRLKWYQEAAANPDSHALMLTSMFGITKGEVAAGFSPGHVGNVIDLANASPWAVQYSKDLDRLSLFDEG